MDEVNDIVREPFLEGVHTLSRTTAGGHLSVAEVGDGDVEHFRDWRMGVQADGMEKARPGKNSLTGERRDGGFGKTKTMGKVGNGRVPKRNDMHSRGKKKIPRDNGISPSTKLAKIDL